MHSRDHYLQRVSLDFRLSLCNPSLPLFCHHHERSAGMAEIKIDKNLFQERLSHFYSAWKADKRSGDAVFGGVSSILVLMGKTEESVQFQKNNALHVCTLPANPSRRIITNDVD
jgi:hypothetical protein